jgi:hypothetical protein
MYTYEKTQNIPRSPNKSRHPRQKWVSHAESVLGTYPISILCEGEDYIPIVSGVTNIQCRSLVPRYSWHPTGGVAGIGGQYRMTEIPVSQARKNMEILGHRGLGDRNWSNQGTEQGHVREKTEEHIRSNKHGSWYGNALLFCNHAIIHCACQR